jgi:hypothetical protein
MAAKNYQRLTEPILRQHFDLVRLEWSIAKGAIDAFSPDVRRYAPRVDIAIGPFNITRGREHDISEELLRPDRLRAVFAGRTPNVNPRCLLAIEVAYSGSSKHMMGDILNASALGLFGMIVGHEHEMPKIRRILRYLEQLAELEKMPSSLFRNVIALNTAEFDALFA